MPERRCDYFFDTVTLSNFALVRRLDLLTSRYGRRLCVTRQVLDEAIDGIVAGYAALAAVEEAVAGGAFTSAEPLSPDERDTYRQLLRVLAPGEASCIACAKGRRGIVVTDDRAARECCNERGVGFTGTVGILKACCLEGALSPGEADTILASMIDAGYHSSVQRISDLV
jgi:predicted nucleic acid-binding protein